MCIKVGRGADAQSTNWFSPCLLGLESLRRRVRELMRKKTDQEYRSDLDVAKALRIGTLTGVTIFFIWVFVLNVT